MQKYTMTVKADSDEEQRMVILQSRVRPDGFDGLIRGISHASQDTLPTVLAGRYFRPTSVSREWKRKVMDSVYLKELLISLRSVDGRITTGLFSDSDSI